MTTYYGCFFFTSATPVFASIFFLAAFFGAYDTFNFAIINYYLIIIITITITYNIINILLVMCFIMFILGPFPTYAAFGRLWISG